MAKNRYNLSFDEMMAARHIFNRHAEEYITSDHDLRTTLAEIGQFPPQAELETVMDCFENKVSYNNFCLYLTWLKRSFLLPEATDTDTVRAFAALGGRDDRKGIIQTTLLRDSCRECRLTIDLDKMLREVDEDGSGEIDYGEFKAMWAVDDEGEVSTDGEIPGDDDLDLTVPEERARGPKPRSPLGRRPSSVKSMRPEEGDEATALRMVREFLCPAKDDDTLAKMQTMASMRKGTKSFVGRSMLRRLSANNSVRLPPLDIRSVEEQEVPEGEDNQQQQEQKDSQKAQTARPPAERPSGLVFPDQYVLGQKASKRKLASTAEKFTTSPRIVKSPRQPESARDSSMRSSRRHGRTSSQSPNRR